MKYDLIIENWNKFLEGKFDFLKKKSFKKPPEEPEEKKKPQQKIRLDFGRKMKDKWGSEHSPCDPDDSSKRRDLGKHIFHPFDPNRDTEDWECNTELEDQLLNAIQVYVRMNSAEKIQGKIGEFIIDYFKDKTDNSLPLSRFAKNVALYRGLKLELDEVGLGLLQQVDWEKGTTNKIEGIKWGVYPPLLPYKLRRETVSFSYEWSVGKEFATKGNKPVQIVFQTSGNSQTKGGGFFVDFSNFYNLYRNRNYTMINKLRFRNVRNYAWESEALLIGKGAGDELPLTNVHINLDVLQEKIMELDGGHPLKKDFMEILKQALTRREKRRIKKKFKSDSMGTKKWMETGFQKAIASGDLKQLQTVGNELQGDLKKYENNIEAFALAIERQEILDHIQYLKQTIQKIWSTFEDMLESSSKRGTHAAPDPDIYIPPEPPSLVESKTKKVRVLKTKNVSNKI